MDIRKMTPEEQFEAMKISTFCFHGIMDDPEGAKARLLERAAKGPQKFDDWGAFDEDGQLMARIINNHFDFYIDGKTVVSGGIGGVSNWPEYRNTGVVKSMFREILRDAYDRGEVISALSPFNQEFYRKRGYEILHFQDTYTMSPALLTGYRFNGKVIRWDPEDPVTPYLELFHAFAKNYNMAMPRTEEKMREHMNVEYFLKDRRFTYLLQQDGENLAYVTFRDLEPNGVRTLEVEECAWISRDGFWAILGFLGRFTADYKKVKITLPKGIDLMRLIQSPRAYEAEKECKYDFMVRVINAPKLLEAIVKPADCDFTIQVTDEDLVENNGIWRVTAAGVTACPEGTTADLVLNERALAQMALGSVNLDEALLRMDVELHNPEKESMLSRTFIEKKIKVTQFF